MKYLLTSIFLLVNLSIVAQDAYYCWLEDYKADESISSVISPPSGFSREELKAGSLAEWLRGLPLKEGRPEVLLFDGSKKYNQDAHHSVIKMDVGRYDLQQCADAVMRLKAEYHFGRGEYEKIHFNFTSGDVASYSRWRDGWRASIAGSKVKWTKKSRADDSYKSFRKYMKLVFTYAGTYSLSKELVPVKITDIQAGDVFIKGGFPGHAVMVMDVVIDKAGNKQFLLAQSYMPAQEMHILKNPNSDALSPWYEIPEGELITPEWSFSRTSLKRFK